MNHKTITDAITHHVNEKFNIIKIR